MSGAADRQLRMGAIGSRGWACLMPDPDDRWWTIREDDSIETIAENVTTALVNYGLPELERVISDEGLRDLYLAGQSGWLSKRQRLARVIRLVSLIGPQERLPELLVEQQRADGRAHAEAAEFESMVAEVLSGAGFQQKRGSEHEWIAPADWPERTAKIRDDPTN
jgi:hypothetical protein